MSKPGATEVAPGYFSIERQGSLLLFISNIANYTLFLRQEKPIYTPKGDLVTVEPALTAFFTRGLVPSWGRDQAKAAGMVIRGKSDEEDTDNLYSGYCTVTEQYLNGWDDATREWVEQRMLNHAGGYGSAYIRVEKESALPPSKNWVKNTSAVGRRTLEQAVSKAVDDVREQGFDPADVIAFESDANRKESAAIIAALQALDEEEVVPDEDLVSA